MIVTLADGTQSDLPVTPATNTLGITVYLADESMLSDDQIAALSTAQLCSDEPIWASFTRRFRFLTAALRVRDRRAPGYLERYDSGRQPDDSARRVCRADGRRRGRRRAVSVWL
ncbi:MAG: hypothetical protein ACLUN5_02595 [Oscillospiraceae bacterium]